MTAQMFFTNPIVIAAILAALVILAFIFLRPKQRVTLSDENRPLRPHMDAAKKETTTGYVAAEVAEDFLGIPAHHDKGVATGKADDLLLIKGVGPKLAATLGAHGITSFAQIASLSDGEVERLDAQLGAFAGRLKRDRVVEQADYLARGDKDGFEQKFGKL